jgi:hypothetical protein
MEMELEFYSRYNPIALVLPSLYSELKEKALNKESLLRRRPMEA